MTHQCSGICHCMQGRGAEQLQIMAVMDCMMRFISREKLVVGTCIVCWEMD